MNESVLYYCLVIFTIIITNISEISNEDINCNDKLPRIFLTCNLVENYMGTPVITSSTRVNLNMTVLPIDIDFKDEMQSLEVTFRMNMIWKDENLIWDPKTYGLERAFIECDDIWTPVLTSLERNKHVYEDYESEYCELNYNGTVERNVTSTFENTCYSGLDFSLWPFDEHECSILIGIPQTTELNIFLNMQELELHNFEGDLLWDVEIVKPPPVFQPIKRFKLDFKLKRFACVRGTVIIFSTIVLSCLEIGSLLLGIKSEERLLLLGGIIFMLSFFLMFFSYQLPPTGNQTPHLINYYFYLIILSSFIITWTVIGRLLVNMNLRSQKVTEAMKIISSSPVSKLIMFDSNTEVINEIAEDEETPSSTLLSVSKSVWEPFVELIDRIVLIGNLTCILYLKFLYLPHASKLFR